VVFKATLLILMNLNVEDCIGSMH